MIVSKEGASTTVIEVADVFRRYGTEYLEKFGERMPPSHRRAFKDILRCRRPAMGGHVFECNHCGRLQYSYHSCRNRSCPKCHKSDIQAWLQGRQKELLPVPYYHVIFTLTHELRAFVRHHQQEAYGLWSSSNRKKLRKMQQILTQHGNDQQERLEEDMDGEVSPPSESRPCPHCQKGTLVRIGRLFRQGRAPP